MSKKQLFASEGIVTKPTHAIMSGGHQCDYLMPFKRLPANDRIVDAALGRSIAEFEHRQALQDFHPDPAPEFIVVEFEPVEMTPERWQELYEQWKKSVGERIITAMATAGVSWNGGL